MENLIDDELERKIHKQGGKKKSRRKGKVHHTYMTGDDNP
jgi:hypothetical protein